MFKWIATGIVTIVIITISFIVAASLFEEFRVIARDIAIVIVAVFQMISAILLIVLLIAVLYVIRVLNRLASDTLAPGINSATEKVNEVLDSARSVTDDVRESSSAVTATTVFIAERVITPIIRVSSLVTGVRAAATTLARRSVKSEEH